MKVRDAINRAAIIEPNQYDHHEQIMWLQMLDGQIFEEVIRTHEGCPEHFNAPHEMNDDLLVPEPYTDLYLWYLVGRIQISNADLDRYQNTQILYNEALDAYKNWYNRGHKPVGSSKFIL